MKIFLGAIGLVLGAMNIASAQYGSNYQSNRQNNQNQYDQYSQYGQQQQSPQQQKALPSDCSHLSQQEQQFARQLSDMHRTMFCRHFSVSQRIEAMTLASTGATDISGKAATITPDEAVEVVMKNTRQNGNGNGQQQQIPEQPQSPYGNGYSYPSGGNNGSGSSPSPYSY